MCVYDQADMAHYYFHIRNGLDGKYLDVDPDGTYLPTLEAAYALALQMARELWADWSEADRDTVIEIVDKVGQPLLIVPFSDAIGSKH
jgi:hypothetical protein